MNWIRVKPTDRCTVCGKPDFCTYSRELALAHCMRVVSARPSKNRLGGYFHPLDGATIAALPQRRPEPPRPTIDAERLARGWHAQTPLAEFERLAGLLVGVSAASLLALRCGWAMDHRAWSFPMRSGDGRICGIRLRTETGRKFSVTGGREGVFLPKTEPKSPCWCPEGPTSTAALITLGKFAIGRPNCSGGISVLSATIARLGIRQAILLADNDADKLRPNGDRWNPGLDGAQRLAEEIGVPCCILVLPCKDAREFIRMGGTSELLDSLTQSVVWHQPNQSHNQPHKSQSITHATNMAVPVQT